MIVQRLIAFIVCVFCKHEHDKRVPTRNLAEFNILKSVLKLLSHFTTHQCEDRMERVALTFMLTTRIWVHEINEHLYLVKTKQINDYSRSTLYRMHIVLFIFFGSFPSACLLVLLTHWFQPADRWPLRTWCPAVLPSDRTRGVVCPFSSPSGWQAC